MLGLTVRENNVGVAVEQSHRIGEGAHRLAPRLANGPQPGGVEMSVSGCHHAMARASRRSVEDRSQLGNRRSRRTDRIVHIECGTGSFESEETPGPLRVVLREIERDIDGEMQPQGEIVDDRIVHTDVGLS